MQRNEEQPELKMNKTQFELAMKGSRLSKKNRNIAYSILVEKKTRPEVTEQEGISKQVLYQIIKSAEQSLKKHLDANGLTIVELILPKDQVKKAEEQEKVLVKKILGK